MSTLSEIKAAVDALPADEKQELLLFLVASLRVQAGQMTMPRTFTSEQLRSWIDEDEADLQRFNNGTPN